MGIILIFVGIICIFYIVKYLIGYIDYRSEKPPASEGWINTKDIRNGEEAKKFIVNRYNVYKDSGIVSWVELSFVAKAHLIKWGICKSEIIDYLKNNPEYIKQWDLHCQDQRTGASYMFSYGRFSHKHKKIPNLSKKYGWAFGYSSTDNGFYTIIDFDTKPYKICAEYIFAQCKFDSYDSDWWNFWQKFSKNNDVSSVKDSNWIMENWLYKD